jgi:hypothetical protein
MKLAIGLVSLAALLATGCAAGPGHTRAAGALGGTAAGATIGGIAGGGRGAVAGGALGLIAGTIAGEGIAQDQEVRRYGPPPPAPVYVYEAPPPVVIYEPAPYGYYGPVYRHGYHRRCWR